MNLLLLAPDIREVILYLPRAEGEHDPIALYELQVVTGESEWKKRRQRWTTLRQGPSTGFYPTVGESSGCFLDSINMSAKPNI